MIQVKKLSSFAELAFFEKEPVPFFQSTQYLQIFAKNFCKIDDLILLGLYEDEKLVGYGAFEKVDGKIVFLGMKRVLNNQELTDYGDIFLLQTTDYKLPTNQAWQAILNWFAANGFHDAELDYVRENSNTYQFFSVGDDLRVVPQNGPRHGGVPTNTTQISEQEVAPYIVLPTSWEEYISGLEYHSRRELRRKMNRLERDLSGKYKFITVDNITEKHFAEFIRLVKLSEEEKESFMTKEMEKFFWDLVNIDHDNNNFVGGDLPVAPHADRPGGLSLQKNKWYPILNFLEIEGKPVAAILTFENGVESLAYNSGYDPAFKFYSVGLLVHAFKIRDLIDKGFKKYDFLRGHERYKFDLGGKEKKLWKISMTVEQ